MVLFHCAELIGQVSALRARSNAVSTRLDEVQCAASSLSQRAVSLDDTRAALADALAGRGTLEATHEAVVSELATLRQHMESTDRAHVAALGKLRASLEAEAEREAAEIAARNKEYVKAFVCGLKSRSGVFCCRAANFVLK